MNRHVRVYLFAGLAALFWGTSAAAFKKTLSFMDGNVVGMLFYSVLFSLIVLLLMMLIQGKFPRLRGMKRRELAQSALLALLNPFLYYLVLFKAYDLLPGQEAQPLNFTWPIVLVLLSVPLLGQRLKAVHLAAILLSFFGVLVISTQGHVFSFRFTNLPGALLALGSSTIWALYWIYNRRDRRDAVVKLFMNFCFAFLYIGIFAAATGNLGPFSYSALLGTAWIGVFEMGVTFVLWLTAMEKAERTSLIGNVVYLCPFLALVFLRIVVGERILPSSVIGLCLILTGIFIQSKASRSEGF